MMAINIRVKYRCYYGRGIESWGTAGLQKARILWGVLAPGNSAVMQCDGMEAVEANGHGP